jgi:hypothetical protein
MKGVLIFSWPGRLAFCGKNRRGRYIVGRAVCGYFETNLATKLTGTQTPGTICRNQAESKTKASGKRKVPWTGLQAGWAAALMDAMVI